MQRTFENITFWPVFHYRLEFAAVVRKELIAAPPDMVAVELPGTWREPILQGVNRLPYLSVVLGESRNSNLFFPIEPTDAGIEALRTAHEMGIPVELIDLDVANYPFHREPSPDTYALHRLGYEPFLSAYYQGHKFFPTELDERRETLMAHSLQQLSASHSQVACILGADHLPGVLEKLNTPQPRPLARSKKRELRLCNWSEKSSREFLTEPPFLAAAYEHARGKKQKRGMVLVEESATPKVEFVDREAQAELLIQAAAESYKDHYKEELPSNRLETLARFAKKYALVEGQLVPDLYHLVVAARGVADDDFAYEMWEKGSDYPWQDGSGLLPTVNLEEEFAELDGRKLTFHRKMRSNRPRLGRYASKKRLREQFQDEWESDWSGQFICSHQPEDLVIEDYGRYLKHKAKGMLTAERTRVEPFTVSLKDGLDIRETLRNWHERKLFVREVLPFGGEVGSVVVIFDPDEPGQSSREMPLRLAREQYPWRVTWLGEHEQESDMALYATPAGEEVVGPGISRCEYGGFLLSYPPRRMFDVWSDPVFDAARNKPERLLLAALDYSVEQSVLYVAERPPRSWFHTLASRLGKKLIYLPLGQLSPNTIKRIRTFHVLDGQNVRETAKDYIGH